MLEPTAADLPDDFDDEFDPDRLRVCGYWRCEGFFEARTTNQIFCRKACRSRQRKWERSVSDGLGAGEPELRLGRSTRLASDPSRSCRPVAP